MHQILKKFIESCGEHRCSIGKGHGTTHAKADIADQL